MFDEAYEQVLQLINLGINDPEVAPWKADAVLLVAGLSALHQFAKAGIEERWCREGCSTKNIIYTCNIDQDDLIHP